jgi:hypothetical protein
MPIASQHTWPKTLRSWSKWNTRKQRRWARKAATINRRLAALRSLVKLANTFGLVPWTLAVENVKTVCEVSQRRTSSGRSNDGRPVEERMEFLGDDLSNHKNHERSGEDRRTNQIAVRVRRGRGLPEPSHGHRVAAGLTQSCCKNLDNPKRERDCWNFAQNIGHRHRPGRSSSCFVAHGFVRAQISTAGRALFAFFG